MDEGFLVFIKLLNDFRDEKPDNCDVVPQSACAVAYDSGTCSGKNEGNGRFLHKT